MGSSESIFNDSANTVEVWFQSPDEGLCPNNRCMVTTLQPGSTTGKQEFALSLANHVCVKYPDSDGKNTVCKQVISPRSPGQLFTYSVGDIIGKQSIASETLSPSMVDNLPVFITIPALFAIVMLALISIKKLCKKLCGSQKLEQGLQEKLIEENTDAEEGIVQSPKPATMQAPNKLLTTKPLPEPALSKIDGLKQSGVNEQWRYAIGKLEAVEARLEEARREALKGMSESEPIPVVAKGMNESEPIPVGHHQCATSNGLPSVGYHQWATINGPPYEGA